jgi:formimidoylglutamate deiminase
MLALGGKVTGPYWYQAMPERKLCFSSALLPSGWHDDVVVHLDGAGSIVSVETPKRPQDGARLNGIAVPGVANVHSHAHQRAMVGLAERSGPGADSFWTWREAMYGFALAMQPEDLEAVAAQLYVEALKSGFTAVGEFQYLHHQPDGSPYDEPAEMSLRCLAGAERAGIAVTMLPTLYAYGGFGGQPPAEAQRRFINKADSFLGIVENLASAMGKSHMRRLGMSPHSLRAVTKVLLDEVIAGLDRLDRQAPIHIHVAEQVKEVEDCMSWCGRRPVEHLLESFDVSPRWCAIHATHMSDDETASLARSGAVAGLCPTTEANLGDGTFPAAAFLDAAGAIAIGSDSQVTVSPAEDLRQLEYSQRLAHRARNVLAGAPHRSTGRRLLEAVTHGGAQALGQPMGAIGPGMRCDIVVLDPDHPALIGRSGDEAVDSWIFSGGAACVKDVIVGGEIVIRERQHSRQDEILRDFRSAIGRLRDRQ